MTGILGEDSRIFGHVMMSNLVSIVHSLSVPDIADPLGAVDVKLTLTLA